MISLSLSLSQVLNTSKNAASRIKEILSDKMNSNKIGLRISVKSGGCAGLTYDMSYIDTLNKEDEVVEDNGVKIFIDQKALIYLVGTVMDYKRDKFSSSFVFQNPNEIERCGCENLLKFKMFRKIFFF